ncbi:heme peroxidase [Mycena pura]|uniref:Heme peroxidase n=1 Tax=Mycena pura TaxID=153505 RepID=A0AAD6VBK4_9AGAR|nr:heme peroxidase [Mycena pura]
MSLLDLIPYLHKHTRNTPFEFSDVSGYVDALMHHTSLDDRKLLAGRFACGTYEILTQSVQIESIVTLMSRLSTHPTLAPFSNTLQDALVERLYKDLPHPPSTYLSIPQNTTTETMANPVKYAYRSADGSNYVPLFPGLGKANSPYSRSVPSTNVTLPATLPDSGLVFDMLMRREAFVPHPGGISALFFAFANLVIHTVFHTKRSDPTINLTSSYLDLSILYGDNQAQQDSVRNKDGRGRLYEDVFADSRLLHVPPSAAALLVLLSRNHNYAAQKILEINEYGTYKTEFKTDAQKLAQDDEIFNRARLVTCGYFMQITLGDYVGAILGLVRDGYAWRLDTLSQSRKSHDPLPRGEGNVVSMEFNLMYRWHATLSEQDTEWTENHFKELFETEDLSNLTMPHKIKNAMITDPDPRRWTFDHLQRGPDGRFKDSDLARILQSATSCRAGAFKARGIPEVLRVIEVLGIEQARRWGACSMNDYRRFTGLKPFASFEEWNPDKKIHTAAAALYKDIENLELYVGLHAEDAKKPMAGAGLCPGYTMSRAILSDAICLTRGDRFLTLEFTPLNLTAWGYNDCQLDPEDGTCGGGMLTKLLFRTLPGYYPPRSAYAHFPFLEPKFMRDTMRESQPELVKKYNWMRPVIHANVEDVVVFKTVSGVRAVLEDQVVFPAAYAQRLEEVVGRKCVDRGFVMKMLLPDLYKWTAYFEMETQRLIEKRCFNFVGRERSVQSVDIVRDVINMLPVHWICGQLAGLPLRDDVKDERRQYEQFSDVCRYVFLNTEPWNAWRLRESSVQTFNEFADVVEDHLGSWLLDSERSQRVPFLNKLYAENHSAEDIAVALFTEVVPTAAHWSQALAHIVNFYLDDSRAEERAWIVELTALRTRRANEQVAALAHAALAIDPPVWGVYRTAQKTDCSIDAVNIPVNTTVFASIKEANASAKNMNNPIFGIGQLGLLEANFFDSTIPRVLGKILALKGLKRAPGRSGKFNRFVETVHGATQQWYLNSRSDVVPWPESLVVEFDV